MGTLLRRIGNKAKLLPVLLPLFPEKITTFIDLFEGERGNGEKMESPNDN